MNELIAAVFDPNNSLLGRILAIGTLAAVAIFFWMARYSMDSSARRQIEEREAEEKAERIVAQVRRERAQSESNPRDA